jgi:sugar lactone lactonase YvrE
MYQVDYVYDKIAEWTLTTANDMSTATFVGYSPIITGTNVIIRAVYFRADGLRMYVTDSTANTVRQYSLSTAWAVSTISLQATYTRPDGDPLAQGISFSDDGTKMYIAGYDDIEQFTLSTPWNVSTASLLQQVEMPESSYITDLYFKPDGTKVYVSDDPNTPRRINQYDLSTAWDVSTIIYKDSFLTGAYGSGVGSVSFGGSDGEIMYILFDDDERIMTVYWP